MPPALALSVTLLACMVVYIKDRRNTTGISGATWIPVLWMMRCGSRSIDLWFNPDRSSLGEGGLLDQAFVVTALTCGLFVLWGRKLDWSTISSDNRYVVALYLYVLASTMWSAAPMVSLHSSARMITDIIVVLVILSEANPFYAIMSSFRQCFIWLIPLSIVLIKYFRFYGTLEPKHLRHNFWIGVATHKNSLGLLAMLAALTFLWSATHGRRKSRLVALCCLGMSIYLLNGDGHSRSTTSLVLLIIAIIAYWMMKHYKGRVEVLTRRMVAIGIVVVAGYITLDFVMGIDIESEITVMLGKDPTLTGRKTLWSDLIDLGRQHMVLGYGNRGFWNASNMRYLKEIHDGIHSWGPSQAHNGYIDIFLNYGVVGLALFFLVVLSYLRRSLALWDSNYDYGRTRLIVGSLLLIHNYSESSILRPTNLAWLTFLVMAMTIREQRWTPTSRGNMKGEMI